MFSKYNNTRYSTTRTTLLAASLLDSWLMNILTLLLWSVGTTAAINPYLSFVFGSFLQAETLQICWCLLTLLAAAFQFSARCSRFQKVADGFSKTSQSDFTCVQHIQQLSKIKLQDQIGNKSSENYLSHVN